MKCPFCGSFDGQVLDSRPIEHTSAIRRRRQCNQCKKRYAENVEKKHLAKPDK